MTEAFSLRDLELCFEGVVPAVIATAAADGTPNITYLSRVRMVDDERVALSNQFFSKTSRNLVENPRANVLVIEPVSYDMFRLTLAYERTERRGVVFEQLRDDVDAVAALEGMQDVFKLRAADVYRVLHIEQVPTAAAAAPVAADMSGRDIEHATRLAELSARLSRCPDLDTLVERDGRRTVRIARLRTLDAATRRRARQGPVHDREQRATTSRASDQRFPWVKGSSAWRRRAAPRCASATCATCPSTRRPCVVRTRTRDTSVPGREIPLPGLSLAQSRVAVPAMAFGQLVGVLVVESADPVAFTATDESLLTVVASVVANAIEVERTHERAEDVAGGRALPEAHVDVSALEENATQVRFFAIDGSTFLDGDYLIKGVSGRILWSLLGQYEQEGRTEFTNREVRLDPDARAPGVS